jgi:formyl-CoA transferase
LGVGQGPLAGIRVLELGRYIAAPFAGRQLAELGATVLKIEDPDGGDPMRSWEGGDRPYSPQFAAYNHSKHAVTLDLRSASGSATLRTLAAEADVLLENFRPGVMARLGLSADILLGLNPALIFCSLTGFGTHGPYALRPTYDTVVSAMSGLYSVLLPAGSAAPVGPAMSDLLAGLFAVQGVLAALHVRHSTGSGQVVDVTMLGASVGFVGEAVTSAAETGTLIEPNTRQRRAQAYGAVAGDGKAFVVHLSVPDKFWRALCAAMDRPDWLADPRLATRSDRFENYAVLESLIRDQARTRSRDEWFDAFGAHDLPHAPLNSFLDLDGDEQVRAMGLLTRVPMPDDAPPMTFVVPPARFSATPTGTVTPAPVLGADNDLLPPTVLTDLSGTAGATR